MQKRLLLITILVAVAFTFSIPMYAADPVIVMKIGHSQPVTHPRHISLLKFKEIVEKETKGQIRVEIYPSSQLGSEAEQMESVKMGALQATRGGQFEAATPELLIYTMPFLFKDVEAVHKITRGSMGEKIAKYAEKNGIVILATGDAGGLRNISNNIRPITKPEDMKGLKMRTPPIESIIETMKALGANPVSIPYNELYLALKTGVADGQENPYVNIVAMKFYEVQKYLSVLNYQYHPDPFYVGLKWYKSLSRTNQRILKKAAVEMMLLNDKLIDEATVNDYNLLKQKMVVNVLTEAERKPFIEKAQVVYDFYKKKGLVTVDKIAEIRNITK